MLIMAGQAGLMVCMIFIVMNYKATRIGLLSIYSLSFHGKGLIIQFKGRLSFTQCNSTEPVECPPVLATEVTQPGCVKISLGRKLPII